MTTFTTEDRIFTAQYPWPTEPWANAKDYRQAEIPFFWPLTEQIPLDLDYGPTHLYYRAKGIAGVHSMPIQGSIHEFSGVTWTTSMGPQLTVQATNQVGQLKIGGVSIGLEKQPKWHQKILYKLLGFNWKNKDHK